MKKLISNSIKYFSTVFNPIYKLSIQNKIKIKNISFAFHYIRQFQGLEIGYCNFLIIF